MSYRLLLLLSLAVTVPAWPQSRQELDLGGEWEFVKVADLAPGPPATGWAPMQVPGVLGGYDYERAWFRRDFTVPEAMRGQRLELHFGGVKWNSTVRVNGQTVGGHFGGYEPFDVDITRVARVGDRNRLEVGCHDWTGVFSDRETDFSVMGERPTDPRDLPKDKVLAPLGGLVTQYGIWDQVTLRAHPAVWVSDLFIKPAVRQGKLTVDFTVSNASAEAVTVSVVATVDDAGQTALRLPTRRVTVAAGGKTEVTAEAPWDSPHLWSPEDPYLYHLVTRLERDGQALDELRTRFGFREFWVDGPRFYLNGSRVNLLATSWWPELFKDRQYIRERMLAIKAAHCVIFRTHTQPWPEVWYEVADEVGLMMIPEGAVWNDDEAYRVNDPAFWENYAAHLKAMVDRDKNKPSVVMYSLENEFYGSRVNNDSPARLQLARLGRLMKQWDPTRPIFYESDGDPEGVADAVGLHYPHEYPDFTQWPNTAYWMDTPLTASYFFVPDPAASREWIWDRTKPVYIGEFLWVPSADPSWHTVFFGDEAYLDYNTYRNRAKGEAWRMAIQAYRYYEVGGISPWTMVEGGPLDDTNPLYAAHQYAMQPMAAYVREYSHTFYSGATVRRTADVYNDVLRPSTLTVQWAVVDGERELAPGERVLELEPGERQELQFTVTLPEVAQRREVALRLRVLRDGQIVFEDRKPWSVFPRRPLTAPPGLGLYDPAGETTAALQRLGLQARQVEDLGAIPDGVRVLVIGAGAFGSPAAAVPVIGVEGAGSASLLAFARRGGRVLVLEQEAYPAGMLPVTLTRQASTMTFAQMPHHPLLRGIQPNDLRWWGPDHLVSMAEPLRPRQGGVRAVVVSGSKAGLAHAPLMEMPAGEGAVVICQLLVGQRVEAEPVAFLLLQNALDYLAEFRPQPSRTALYCPDAVTREHLADTGLRATDITAAPAAADWDAIDLLIACSPVQGLAPAAEQLGRFLQRGGKALLHGLTPQEFAVVSPWLGGDLRLLPYAGPVTRVPGAHPLAEFLTNEDLYWLGEQRAAHSWATIPRADNMASAVISKSLEGKPVREYGHERMTVAGTYANNEGETAVLASGGSTASVEIEVAAEGAYLLGVVAGGRAAYGVWPAGSVTVDGRPLGVFACQSGELDTYVLAGELTAGKHQIVITFTNDAYDPANRQDRNLVVKSLLVAADERREGVSFLTSPAALTVIETGGGLIVVDNINWDRTESNRDKASRYIAGLLNGLGAEFQAGSARTVIEPVTFEPQPGLPWFRRENGSAYMGSNGYISGPFECARAGRYVFRFSARGTAVEDVFPVFEVAIDGARVGQVQLMSDGWRSYPLTTEVTPGRHELRLSFINDAQRGSEDRNLWLGQIEVTRVP